MDGNVLTVWGQFFKSFIDRTTMYRLMLYYLLALFIAALSLSAVGYLHISLSSLLWSASVLAISSWLSNKLFARVFGAVANVDASLITGLILALVLAPTSLSDIAGSVTLAAVAVIASASKYILAFRKKHIFNPVAFALALSALLLGVQTAWWASGSLFLIPFILIGGLMVAYKLQKFDLITAFFAASLITVATISPNFVAGVQAAFLYSAILFFAFVMLTEPLTMPNTRALRIVYGILIGVLFIWSPSIGSLHFSPELALIAGNLFAFFAEQKGRYTLSLIKRNQLASGIYEYIFHSDCKIIFKSGQYLEWTLGGVPYDNRGNRRFFTIASAPEEDGIALGTRFPDEPSPVRDKDSVSPGRLLVGVSNGASAFKRTLAELPVGGVVSASSLGGDFTMPKDTRKKLAFIAGGIGVTPFASMARHCIASGESRDAILLYSSKTASEVAYQDVFKNAERVGWRAVYRIGAIDSEFIKREVPDYLERLFYISGPPGMVDAMKKMLIELGVSRFSIKTDFFPGLA